MISLSNVTKRYSSTVGIGPFDLQLPKGGVTEYWKLGLGVLILAVVLTRAVDLSALLRRTAR